MLPSRPPHTTSPRTYKTWLSWLVIVAGIYFLIRICGNLLHLRQAQQLVTREREKVEQLNQENQQLTQRYQEVQTDEFIEQQAREQLNMTKPGETLVLIPQELLQYNPQPQPYRSEQNLPNWQQWWQLFKDGGSKYF
jgi:cell division protein FtsB